MLTQLGVSYPQIELTVDPIVVVAHGMAAVAFWRVGRLWLGLTQPDGLVTRLLRRAWPTP